MARIPTVTNDITARSGRTTGRVGARGATAADFGAAGGQALQALGGGLARAGAGLHDFVEAKRSEDAANAVAQADFTREELEMRNTVGADAAGYQEQTLDRYDEWIEEQAEGIDDDETRQRFKERMAAQRPALSSRAAQYELGTRAQNSRDEADASLVALDNKIRLSPDQYDAHIEQGFAVIDARTDVPAVTREKMKTTWRQNAALSRFEGMLESATTIEDVQALQAELEDGDRDWTSELSSAGMERVRSLSSAASKAIQTKADADARAAIEGLEGRATDVTAVIPKEELRAVQNVVAKSKNPITAARMQRIVRDQAIIAETRKMPPARQRELLNTKYNNPSLPAKLNAAIGRASKLFGVSPAYLASTAKREYGVFLKNKREEDISYGEGNIGGNSSATGVMQFIDETWLGVVNNPRFQAATGISTKGMSRQQILDMRKDVDIALLGGAFFTSENARAAKSALGREPTDADLYIMHFMGAGGGPRLFRMMKANPDVIAADMFPGPAKANRSVYYDKSGRARTVLEVYRELGRMHGTGDGSETGIEYGDRQTREDILDKTEKRIADDPMDHAFRTGTVAGGDVFGEGGMEARGEAARAVADYYSIPASDMKPFTNEEAARIAKQFQDGSADEVLAMVTSFQEMGSDMARAAMAQVGKENSVYAFAGGLQLETGQGAVAAEVVRGQKRLEENPDIKKQTGASPQDLSDAFLNATGGALMDAAPSQRQAISDAALAHYVETQVARGGAGAFNPDLYAASVQAVLGGREGSPSLDEVNGVQTVMPPGVTGEALEEAFENMTVADWTAMSEQGEPPRYVTGEIAGPRDLADEAQMRAIGGGRYRVLTSDGSFLVTGNPAPNGQLEPYIFVPTADKVRAVNEGAEAATAQEQADIEVRFTGQTSRAEDLSRAQEDGVITSEEQAALLAKYGAAWMAPE